MSSTPAQAHQPYAHANTSAAPPQPDIALAPPAIDPEIAELRAITLAGLKAILTNPATPPREFRLTAAVAFRFITAAERAISEATRRAASILPRERGRTESVQPAANAQPVPSAAPARPSQPHQHAVDLTPFAPFPLNPPATSAAALQRAAGSHLGFTSVVKLLFPRDCQQVDCLSCHDLPAPRTVVQAPLDVPHDLAQSGKIVARLNVMPLAAGATATLRRSD